MASGYPSAVIFGAFRISPQDSQRAWVAGSTCPALHEPNGAQPAAEGHAGASGTIVPLRASKLEVPFVVSSAQLIRI